MLEKLLTTTQDILHHIEQDANVRFGFTTSLTYYGSKADLANYRDTAEGNHINILYHPETEALDYSIANEALHVNRFIKAPAKEQLVMAISDQTCQEAYQQIVASLHEKPVALHRYLLDQFRGFYYTVLETLVTRPGDFWTNRWLWEHYPSFRDEQVRGLTNLFEPVNVGLDPEMKALTPAPVYRAQGAMNVAYADYLRDLIPEQSFIKRDVPDKIRKAADRLRAANTADNGYSGDRIAVDQWAWQLRLRSWYRWAPLERVEKPYK